MRNLTSQTISSFADATREHSFTCSLPIFFAAGLFPLFAFILLTSPAHALDLNSFRAQHKLPALSYSATLAGAAYEHAHSLARRERLDHDGFKQRVGRLVGGMAAENVSFGCEDQDCAIKQWARSAGHRANMLLKGITSYGIASARGDNGRRYWVLELGN